MILIDCHSQNTSLRIMIHYHNTRGLQLILLDMDTLKFIFLIKKQQGIYCNYYTVAI